MVTTRTSSKLSQQPKIDDKLPSQENIDRQASKSTSKAGKSRKTPKKDEDVEKDGKGTKRPVEDEAEPSDEGDATKEESSHVDKKHKTTSTTYHEQQGHPKVTSTTIEQTKSQHVAEKKILEREDILEYGRIFFLYKPKVETPHPHSTSDIQRLHIILQPHSSSPASTSTSSKEPSMSRLLNIARKVLPGEKGGQIWGFVSEVSEDVEVLHKALGEVTYTTKTRGVRTIPSDRLIATGPYIIHQHSSPTSSAPSSNPTTLVFRTTLPVEPGQVQKAFGVGKEGAFGISVKNPGLEPTGRGRVEGAGLSGKEKAKYPKELQDKFESLRWHPLNPPTFLNYPHSEILLIAHPSSHPIKDDGGSSLDSEMHEIADEGDVEHVKGEERKMVELRIEEEVWESLGVEEGDGEGEVVGGPGISGKWE